jgi:hypothetical protein
VSIVLGLTLAFASACALNWGFLAQHAGASSLPSLELRHPIASLRALAREHTWLRGFAVGLAGWALYIGALALAPLSLVQAFAAGGIGILALLIHVGPSSERMGRDEWPGVALALTGLVLLAVSLGHGTAQAHTVPTPAVLAWLGVAAVLAVVAILVLHAGVGLALAAGVAYGAADVATKAATLGHALFIPVVALASGAAFVCIQLGFQRGRAITVVGLATLVTNALPIAAGLVLFHEALPRGGAGDLRLAGFALVTLAAASLAALARTAGEGEPHPAAAAPTPLGRG